ncbi:4778_t:CDS:2 [Cetraspora pellucida]|uniref:4778_t:CDS:1 n=1 Tax=Cetraspora pellucida TaxID=1433469 RepID=A0ACA9KRY1_9GLOM|nr:4778_t:CDS:2 [Cetraspora pellucida]
MLQEIEKNKHAEDLKMNVLQAIHFIVKSWKEVKDFHQTTNTVFNDIANTIKTLDLFYPMQVEEFLEIPNENIIYEVPSDDEIIRELVETFGNNGPTIADIEDMKDEDNSLKISIVSANMANTSLETIHTFLLQQNDTEAYINILKKIEKFINKIKARQMQQSKIDQFLMKEN